MLFVKKVSLEGFILIVYVNIIKIKHNMGDIMTKKERINCISNKKLDKEIERERDSWGELNYM